MAGPNDPFEPPPDKKTQNLFEDLRDRGWLFHDNGEGTIFMTHPDYEDGGEDNDPESEFSTPDQIYRSLPIPSEIKAHLDLYVIGQEEAKKVVSVALCNHLFRINYNGIECGDPGMEDKKISKSNLMFIGDSGVGKTFILELACKFLKIPFIAVDATRFSASGYVGADVEDILLSLLHKSEGDVEWAQEGLVFIDEFDKLGSAGRPEKDVNTTQVQYALLRMVEGAEIPVPESSRPHSKTILFDTSEVLFVFAGAFGGLSGGKKDRMGSIGFNSSKNEEELQNVTEEDLLKFGIIPEILGRIGQYVQLHALTEAQLKQILNNPNNGPIEQAKRMYKLRFPGKTFPLQEADFCDIIQLATKSKLGARGLSREVQKRMIEYYYE